MGSYIFIIKSISLLRYKMPPTEQQTVPLSESTIKSIGDLKTVSKAIKFPVVSDTVKAATDVVTQISENTHVETARQYLQDGIKTLSETETFNNIQGKVKELNENPRVQEVITNKTSKKRWIDWTPLLLMVLKVLLLLYLLSEHLLLNLLKLQRTLPTVTCTWLPSIWLPSAWHRSL